MCRTLHPCENRLKLLPITEELSSVEQLWHVQSHLSRLTKCTGRLTCIHYNLTYPLQQSLTCIHWDLKNTFSFFQFGRKTRARARETKLRLGPPKATKVDFREIQGGYIPFMDFLSIKIFRSRNTRGYIQGGIIYERV